MGGIDKGLQDFLGTPLALRALRRLAPQVGHVMISANRNLAAYAAMGAAVWTDALPDHAGPLAGFLAGLAHCRTRYLATVPCDSPLLPEDLVARLAAALEDGAAEIAVAATQQNGIVQRQPVFCLMQTTVHDSLVRYTQRGQRKIDEWTRLHRSVEVVFDAGAAFANANTLDELGRLQRLQQHG